jgi:hypothetical protein
MDRHDPPYPRIGSPEEKPAMTQVHIELPEAVHAVLHCAPDELNQEFRLAAAAQW